MLVAMPSITVRSASACADSQLHQYWDFCAGRDAAQNHRALRQRLWMLRRSRVFFKKVRLLHMYKSYQMGALWLLDACCSLQHVP